MDNNNTFTIPTGTSYFAARQLVRAGWVGSSVGSLALVATVIAGARDLRSGLVPWASAAILACVGALMVGSRLGGVTGKSRSATVSVALGAFGCLATALLLAAIGVVGLTGSDVLDNGESNLSAFATLLASIAALIVLPLGLVGFVVSIVRSAQVPSAKLLAVCGIVALVITPVLNAIGTNTVVVHLIPAVAGCVWSAFGRTLRSLV